MDRMQLGVVTLLKSAITQQRCDLPADFDLEAACGAMQRHHMTPLLYEGAVLCGIPQQLPVMQQLFHSYCRALMVSEGQLRQVQRICDAFDQNDIDYMLLKGSKMKALYPKPELRTMGDADILIRVEQYARILPIMEQLGFQPGVESDHELHWHHKELFLELHKRLIPSYNKDFYAYFGEGWELVIKQTVTCYAMTAEDEMVYLFTHFAKHYRDGGIGCRHVVDLWVFLRAHPELDEAAVCAQLERLQLRTFYENIRRLLGVWFEGEPSDEKTDYITDFIFSSGSWGKKEIHIISLGVRDYTGKHDGRVARWNYLVRLAFPGVDILKDKYTILKKAPWMLPLVWIYRAFYKLFSLRERETRNIHRDTLKILSPEKVTNRQQALEYVGLGYHF